MAVALAGALVVIAAAPPSGAVPETGTGSRCVSLAERAERYGVRVDDSATSVSVQGRTIPLTEAGLSDVRPGSSQVALWFHSLAWLIPVAQRSPEAALGAVERYSAALPDPGAGARREVQWERGWSEGQIRRRLETLECLYRRTGSPVVARAARGLGDALLDDRRYYGLPLHPPHNHGAQANVVLTRAGRLFDRPEWVAVARARVLRDREAAFAECGMSDEQSSAYQWLNVSLWDRLARRLDVPANPAPRRAAEALVRPDGVVEPVGGGGARTNTAHGGELWCPDLGWAASTRGGMHHVVRFGPATTRHGHQDHGAVTWFTRGRPVLVDRGAAPKDDAAAAAWAGSRAAHSTLERVDAPPVVAMTGRITGQDAYLLEERGGDGLRRSLRITPDAVTVVDDSATSATAPASSTWIQHWHFAPGWLPVVDDDGTATGELEASDGARVRLACRESGRPVAPIPVRVTSYVGASSSPAWDMQCRARGRSVSFSSTVSWIEGAGTAGTAR